MNPSFPRPRIFASILAVALSLGITPGHSATLFDDLIDPLDLEMPDFVGPFPAILRLIESGKSDVAIPLLQAELERGNNSPILQELLGIALAKVGRIEESLAAFFASLALNGTRSSTHTNLGAVQKAIGQFAEAEASFRQAVELNNFDRRAHQNLGLFAEARGERQQAIVHLEAGIRGTPNSYLGVKTNLAGLYLQTGQPEKATSLLRRWESDADAPDIALEILGSARLALGETAEARLLLERLAERSNSTRPFIELSRLEVAARDFDKALAWLETADKAFPANPSLQFEIGNLFGAQGQYQEAVTRYQSGLEIAPDNAALLRASSLAHYRLKNYASAIELAEKNAEQDPENPSSFSWLATLNEAVGDQPAAITNYERAVDLNPEDWVSLNNLSALLADTDALRALELSERAAKLAPAIPAVQDTLGWAKFKNGDLEGARVIFSSLARQQPQAALAAYRLGLVLVALGEGSAGRAELERSLDLDPDFKFAEDVQNALSKL